MGQVRVLFAVLVLLSAAPIPATAQPGTGTIIFRPYVCPRGYDDQFYPAVCTLTGTLQYSTAFSMASQRAIEPTETGPDGATFVLTPGRYGLDAGIPGDFSQQDPIRCTSQGVPVSSSVVLDAGKVVECEQLIFGDTGRAQNPIDEFDATLTIRARYCDADIAHADFHPNCFGQPVPKQEFTVRNSKYAITTTTDQSGNVTVRLPDFSYGINISGPLAATPVWRFCSSAEHPGIPLLYPVVFYMNTLDITCDIYLLPETFDLAPRSGDHQVGTVEVHYRKCPGGYGGTSYFTDCHGAPIPFAAIDLAGSSDITSARGYSGSDGNVTFRVLPDAYLFPPEILGEPDDHIAVFCADSKQLQVQLAYPVDVTAAERIVCDLYLLPAASNIRHQGETLTLLVSKCVGDSCNLPVEGQVIIVGAGSSQINLTTDENGWARADLSGIRSEFIPFSPQLSGDIEREIECRSISGPIAVDIAGWATWAVTYTFYPAEDENVTCDVLIQDSSNTP